MYQDRAARTATTSGEDYLALVHEMTVIAPAVGKAIAAEPPRTRSVMPFRCNFAVPCPFRDQVFAEILQLFVRLQFGLRTRHRGRYR
jgi:hypothetical protein